tara:strand:- start:864 stop:1250 length:387 start_codon:yes stop_codon:yes gene_type:complete
MSHKFADDSDTDSDEEDKDYLSIEELNEHKKIKKETKKMREEEEELCPECDKLQTDDGCDCRPVCCMVCGANNKIYSMEHILDKETDDYEQACLAERLDGYYCYGCDPHEEEEEEQEEERCSESEEEY